MKNLSHTSVLLQEVLDFLPDTSTGCLLDVTAGGGGHFFAILDTKKNWRGECWDRDPLARERILTRAEILKCQDRVSFHKKTFGEGAECPQLYTYILADLGISSFQLDDPARGMSLFSERPADFRMDPSSGENFYRWLKKKKSGEIEEILTDYGEEPRARKLASALLAWPASIFESAKALAEAIAKELSYSTPSKIHPATRAFQAFRIAVNDELGEVRSLMKWAPQALAPGGRLTVISFHSLEDRIVKNAFKNLADTQDFDILTKKPVIPSEQEVAGNARSRSAKLRVIERRGAD